MEFSPKGQKVDEEKEEEKGGEEEDWGEHAVEERSWRGDERMGEENEKEKREKKRVFAWQDTDARETSRYYFTT